jgi:hypothetical protein
VLKLRNFRLTANHRAAARTRSGQRPEGPKRAVKGRSGFGTGTKTPDMPASKELQQNLTHLGHSPTETGLPQAIRKRKDSFPLEYDIIDNHAGKCLLSSISPAMRDSIYFRD